MNDFIDVHERPSFAKLLPLSFQHLFAMFGATVLVPFLLKVDPATSLFMNGIGTILYVLICRLIRINPKSQAIKTPNLTEKDFAF